MGLTCPHCGLISPPVAQRCDCGYDFETQTLQKSFVPAHVLSNTQRLRVGNRYMMAGGALGFLGLGLAFAMAVFAGMMGGAVGDRRPYLVPGVLVVLGALLFTRGFWHYRRSRS